MKLPVSTQTRLAMLCSFLSLGGFMFGYNLVVIAGVMDMPQFVKDMHLPETYNVYTAIFSSMTLAAVVGALAAGPLADVLGRRGLAMLGALICILGDTLQAAADGLAKVYAGRCVTGISIGILSAAVPIYLTELAEPSSRGQYISFYQLCIVLGISTAFWITFLLSRYKVIVVTWRFALALQLIPNIIYLLGLIFTPQSPRYLIKNEHDDEALRVLAAIRGDGTTSHPSVRLEYAEIKQTISFERRHSNVGYLSFLKKGNEGHRRRILLGISAMVFQQLSGATTLLLYAPLIFRGLGLNNEVTNNFAIAISGTVVVVCTIPAVFFIDKWPRRTAMITGSAICFVAMVVMAAIARERKVKYTTKSDMDRYLHDGSDLNLLKDNPNQSAIAFLVFFYIFLAAFGCFWGPLGWTYPAEIFTQGLRAKGYSLCTAFNWLFTFGTMQLLPFVFLNTQWKTFLIYCILNIVICGIVYWRFPETKGMSLEEIDFVFSANFKHYKPKSSHPKAASETLKQLDKQQLQFESKYLFGEPEMTTTPENMRTDIDESLSSNME
ncbi:general substrate transporter [Dichotomocladium elegans]|nr:general substrate transporter [Dichotomocladium elegans]